MLIEGNEVVSRSTQIAARSLTITASTILAIGWFELPITNLELMGVKGFPSELFSVVAVAMTLFLSVSLFLNWSSDKLALTKWYKDSKVQVTLMGSSPRGGTQSSYLVSRLERLEQEMEKVQPNIEGFQSLESRLSAIEEALTWRKRDLSHLGATAWFLLNVWYFALPLCLAICAMAQVYMSEVAFGVSVQSIPE